MKELLKEYANALEENLEASRAEVQIKDMKRKAYYRLMRAKEAMRAEERELLDNTIEV